MIHGNAEEIWRAYQARVRGFIARRIDDRSMVDDLLQEVFLKIYTNLGQLHETERLGGWLFKIARNVIHDYYRSHKPLETLDEAMLEVRDDETSPVRRELQACFLPMIESLPDMYRDAVRFSEIEGMTQEVVAQRLGLSLSGAKSRVQRGRQQIRGLMEACCRLDFDQRGTVVDYDNKENSNNYC